MSELWGDVCLGLLFWGLANDTTKLADAPTLYPLFGLGANVAQVGTWAGGDMVGRWAGGDMGWWGVAQACLTFGCQWTTDA